MNELDWREKINAWKQWIPLSLLTFFGTFVGFFVCPIAIIWLKTKHQLFHMKPKPNRFGEKVQTHTNHYMTEGSHGLWEYWDVSSFMWPFNKLFWPWGNPEDGYLGEPSGKHSARWDGKERSFRAMFAWSAIRNAFNNVKREYLGCPIEDCEIEWWGDGKHTNHANHVLLNDNHPVRPGWYFVKATHKETGKVYYGYRSVEELKNGKIKHVRYGFKIKPKHEGQTMDPDDKLKGFTMRWTRWANPN